MIFAGLLFRSVYAYDSGRHQLDALEAAVPVGITREEAYARVRALGYAAYGLSQATADADAGVIFTRWNRYYNATVPWPDDTTNRHMFFAVIEVPIGGVICDKRAVLMIAWDPMSDLVTERREVGPDLRCWLPVVPK